jgi:hypothetical protein
VTRYWYYPVLLLLLSIDSIIELETVMGNYILTSRLFTKKPPSKSIEAGNEMKMLPF